MTRTPLQAAWLALGEHFLDTETRHLLPLTALACVDAGLDPDAVRETWWNELFPVLGSNLLDVAGEWAGWDEAWLLASVEKAREARRASGPVRRSLRKGLHPRHSAETLESLVRCVEHLGRVPRVDREPHAQVLSLLARHVFDFIPRASSEWEPRMVQRARTLAPATVLTLLGPALLPDERAVAEPRLAAVLRDSAASPSS